MCDSRLLNEVCNKKMSGRGAGSGRIDADLFCFANRLYNSVKSTLTSNQSAFNKDFRLKGYITEN